MKLDEYMTQEELKSMWEIRQKAFARITLETANHLAMVLPDGDAKENAKRLAEVAKEVVDAYASPTFYR